MSIFTRIAAALAIRAAERAALRYEAYQSQPASGAWNVRVATALRHVAERKAARAAALIAA